jgi:hypothetical protein
MLIKENTKAVPEQAVLYKFRVRDFADLFEGLSAEQTHIALEAAFNIKFGSVVSLPDVPEESEEETEEPQTPDQDATDFVENVFNEAVMAMYNISVQETVSDEPVDETEEESDSIEGTAIYKQLEEILTAIIDQFTTALDEDNFNQDVLTLNGEMEFFTRIEIYTYFYDTSNEILSVTLTSTL